jgi:F0F1-type ATP synthase assembly protein I
MSNEFKFHKSTIVGLVIGLFCGLLFQGMAKEYYPYFFIGFFVLGWYATRPNATIRSHGVIASRVLQVLAIGFMLFILYVNR